MNPQNWPKIKHILSLVFHKKEGRGMLFSKIMQEMSNSKLKCVKSFTFSCNLRAATIKMNSSTGVFSLFCRLGVVYLIFRVLPREGWLMIFG